LGCELTARGKSSCISDWKLVELMAERRRSGIKSLKSCLMPLVGPAEKGRPPMGSLGVSGVALPLLRDEDMLPIIS
jgi:hypothetical protein